MGQVPIGYRPLSPASGGRARGTDGPFPRALDQKDESKVSKTFSTVKQVEALSEPGRYRDKTTPGLYIGVSIGKTGISKSYVWRGRVGGNREREIGLGSVSKVALTDARKAARQIAVDRDKGIDPIDARKAARKATGAKISEAAKKVPTFEFYARKAIRDTTDNFRNAYGAKAYLRTFEKSVFPGIGTIPIDGITTRHIADVLKGAAAGGHTRYRQAVAGAHRRHHGRCRRRRLSANRVSAIRQMRGWWTS